MSRSTFMRRFTVTITTASGIIHAFQSSSSSIFASHMKTGETGVSNLFISRNEIINSSFNDENNEYRSTAKRALNDIAAAFDDKDDEEEVALKQSKLQQKQQQPSVLGDIDLPSGATLATSVEQWSDANCVTFDVTLPMTELDMSLRQIDGINRASSSLRLDLKTLQYVSNVGTDASVVSTIGNEMLSQLMDAVGRRSSAVVIDAVAPDCASGLRVGDVLVGTSATMGEQVWAKSTLVGIRSAISSRKVMGREITLRIARFPNLCPSRLMSAQSLTESFELSLYKPLGIQVADDVETGGVRVTNIAANATAAVRSTVVIGDKIVGVDSPLKSGEIRTVSTVDGLVSSVTGRLPGQPVRLKFERVVQVDAFDEVAKSDEAAKSSVKTIVAGSNAHKLLLSRCRRVLNKYLSAHESPITRSTALRSNMPVQAANKVLQALNEASAPIDSKTLSLVMESYLSCRDADSALKAYEDCVGLNACASGAVADRTRFPNIKPEASIKDLSICTSLLKAHAARGDYVSGGRVLTAMEGKSGQFSIFVDSVPAADWTNDDIPIGSDVVCYNIVLDAACRSGNVDAALTLFDLMCSMHDGTVTPNMVTYNTLMGAFAREGRVSDVYTLFYEAKQRGLVADKITYTTLIKAACQQGDEQKGLDLLNEMVKVGIQPDVVTFNTVIEALCDSGKWYMAKGLTADMERRGVEANAVTYNLLMTGLLHSDKAAATLTLFEVALADRSTASLAETVEIYTTAIAASAKLADYDRTMDLYTRMVDAKLEPNIKTLTAIISSCVSSENYSASIPFIEAIKSEGMDRISLKAAIRAYCATDNTPLAWELLSEDRTGHKQLTGKDARQAFDTMLESSLRSGDYVLAKNLIEEMILVHNFIPAKWTYKAILRGVGLSRPEDRNVKYTLKKESDLCSSSAEKFDYLLHVLDNMLRRNLAVDISFYSTILFEATKLGGNARRVGSLMPKARIYTSETKDEMINMKLTWSALIRQNLDFRKVDPDEILLPKLVLRTNSKSTKGATRRMYAAEQSVYLRNKRIKEEVELKKNIMT